MTTPGHIGIAGVSVEGALLCTRIIQSRAELLPADHRPQVSLHMLPFAAYAAAMARPDWPAVTELLLGSIGQLHRAGADFAIIPANAVHYAIDEVARRAPIPVLNLVDAVADECRRRGHTRVGILGAMWTMQGGLYSEPLRRRGIEAVVPTKSGQTAMHEVITGELFANRVLPESTARLLTIVRSLRDEGCQAMILACTELPMVLSEENCGIPTVDTTRLLAELALARTRSPAPERAG